MKYLTFILLFICIQVTSQVPVLLKSKNTDAFNVFAYEVKYHIGQSDSVKIDGFIDSDLQIKYIGDLTYSATLALDKWYLLLFVDSKGNKKNLFFQTDILSLSSPLTVTADFLSPDNYYIQYDPIKKIYVGGTF